MSYRITRRSRPRCSGYAWPFLTNTETISVATATAFRPTYVVGSTNLLGSLNRAAIMELLYGVKKFNVVASFSGTDVTPGDVTGNIDVDIISKVAVSPYPPTNELTNFENTPSPNGDSCFFEGEAATGTLTLTGNAVAAETVTIGAKTYTWRASVSTTANEVKIGASASDSIDNLIAAITLGAGSGTVYGSLTTVHPTATATAGAGDTMTVTAITAVNVGDTIVTTETMTNGSFGAATLTLNNTLDGETVLIPIHRSAFPSYPAPYGVPIDHPTGLDPGLDIVYINRPGGNDWDMDGMFFTRLYDGGGANTGEIISFSSTASDPAELPIAAVLVLSCGNFSLKCTASSPLVATLDSASCTITATEWHEYQTTAGLPAFSSSTGLPVNGGPGA